jgi:serine/threonine protein kinase
MKSIINQKSNYLKMESKIFKSIDEIIHQDKDKEKTIGTGAFSKVYLVHHIQNPSKLYAMKILLKKNEDEIRYIKQEIELHKNLQHSYIIRLEDILETEKEMFIFLEYAEKGDLFELLRKEKVTDFLKLKFFKNICEAVKYIHNLNIMHRDLKPENILVDANNNVKLCDFGWSALFQENSVRKSFCGTYEYMAPEVFKSDSQNPKTDIWSLGILLYELFHCTSPFRFKNIPQFLQAIKTVDIKFKDNIHPKISNLILKILKYNQQQRPCVNDILKDELFEELNNPYFDSCQIPSIFLSPLDSKFCVQKDLDFKNNLQDGNYLNLNFAKKKDRPVYLFKHKSEETHIDQTNNFDVKILDTNIDLKKTSKYQKNPFKKVNTESFIKKKEKNYKREKEDKPKNNQLPDNKKNEIIKKESHFESYVKSKINLSYGKAKETDFISKKKQPSFLQLTHQKSLREKQNNIENKKNYFKIESLELNGNYNQSLPSTQETKSYLKKEDIFENNKEEENIVENDKEEKNKFEKNKEYYNNNFYFKNLNLLKDSQDVILKRYLSPQPLLKNAQHFAELNRKEDTEKEKNIEREKLDRFLNYKKKNQSLSGETMSFLKRSDSSSKKELEIVLQRPNVMEKNNKKIVRYSLCGNTELPVKNPLYGNLNIYSKFKNEDKEEEKPGLKEDEKTNTIWRRTDGIIGRKEEEKSGLKEEEKTKTFVRRTDSGISGRKIEIGYNNHINFVMKKRSLNFKVVKSDKKKQTRMNCENIPKFSLSKEKDHMSMKNNLFLFGKSKTIQITKNDNLFPISDISNSAKNN